MLCVQLTKFEKYEKARTRLYIDIFRVFIFRLILIMALIISLIRKVENVSDCLFSLAATSLNNVSFDLI